MRDEALQQAYQELRALLDDPRCPERVKLACLRLSDVQIQLFCSVSDTYRTGLGTVGPENHSGASDLGMRLEPSNFLRELLAALRAFDWPKVLSSVHAILPNDPVHLHPNADQTGPPREADL
jgi:hypothetical protein